MENIQIEIDKTTNGWKFHYGEVVVNEKEYNFSVLEMYDANSDYSSYEITWEDETPDSLVEIESAIIQKVKQK